MDERPKKRTVGKLPNGMSRDGLRVTAVSGLRERKKVGRLRWIRAGSPIGGCGLEPDFKVVPFDSRWMQLEGCCLLYFLGCFDSVGVVLFFPEAKKLPPAD